MSKEEDIEELRRHIKKIISNKKRCEIIIIPHINGFTECYTDMNINEIKKELVNLIHDDLKLHYKIIGYKQDRVVICNDLNKLEEYVESLKGNYGREKKNTALSTLGMIRKIQLLSIFYFAAVTYNRDFEIFIPLLSICILLSGVVSTWISYKILLNLEEEIDLEDEVFNRYSTRPIKIMIIIFTILLLGIILYEVLTR